MFSSEIQWMINKAKVEIVDGFECGKFSAKIPAAMGRKVVDYTRKNKYASTDGLKSYKHFISDGSEENSYCITVHTDGLFELYFERKVN